MSRHTPGPWEVINSTGVFSALGADSGDGTPADSNDGWNICDCSVGVTAVDGEHVELGFSVQKANARLVAAAPDLLEACEEFRNVLRSKVRNAKYSEEYAEAFFQAEKKMDRAISLAKGESQ